MGKYLDLIGLGYLIEKIQAMFIKKTDTIPVTSLAIDTTPTNNSDRLITSGGVKAALDTKQDTIDSSHKLSADLVLDGTTNKVYTSTEKSKLAGIASGAEVNVQVDWNVTDTSSDAYIQNKPSIPAVDVALTTSELDEAWSAVFEAPISFSINSVTYQAEERMTWVEWVASDYNIDGFYVYNNKAINLPRGDAYVAYKGVGVDISEIIIADRSYSSKSGRI